MRRGVLTGAIVAVAALTAASTFGATQPKLVASRSTVKRGGVVTFAGRGCPPGGTVYLFSKLFPGQSYDYGVLTAKVSKAGRFTRLFRVPTTRSDGSYAVTGRCGGGNLGVVLHVRVSGGTYASLRASPARVARGDTVTFSGGTCSSGDTVRLISRLFPGRAYGGSGAITIKAGPDGRFRTSFVVPHAKSPGLYAVTARCGGGNLGIATRVRVS